MFTETQLREAFHFCFLERLLKISDPAMYVLKGGVNLRFFLNSPRYSEDIDLDVLAGGVNTLKKNGYKILKEASFLRNLRTYGINDIEINDPEKAKHTETTQRFRVGLITPSGNRLPSKVEFSRRASQHDNIILEMINPKIARQYNKLAFRVQHYSGESAVIQKIGALAGRSETQARDVFDLGILHAGGYADTSLVSNAIPDRTRRQAIDAMLSLTYEDFSGQVLEFLDTEDRAVYDAPAAWEQLQESILGLLDES